MQIQMQKKEHENNMSIEDALQMTATEILSRNARSTGQKNNILNNDNNSTPLVCPKKLNLILVPVLIHILQARLKKKILIHNH